MESKQGLAPDMQRFVDRMLASGRYESRDEVLRAALRMLEEREHSFDLLDTAIARGLAHDQARRVQRAEDVMAKMSFGAN